MFYYIRNIFDKDMSAFDSSAIDIPPISNDIELDNEIQQIFMLPDFLDVGFCFLNSGKSIIFFNYVIVTMYYYIFLLLYEINLNIMVYLVYNILDLIYYLYYIFLFYLNIYYQYHLFLKLH